MWINARKSIIILLWQKQHCIQDWIFGKVTSIAIYDYMCNRINNNICYQGLFLTRTFQSFETFREIVVVWIKGHTTLLPDFSQDIKPAFWLLVVIKEQKIIFGRVVLKSTHCAGQIPMWKITFCLLTIAFPISKGKSCILAAVLDIRHVANLEHGAKSITCLSLLLNCHPDPFINSIKAMSHF